MFLIIMPKQNRNTKREKAKKIIKRIKKKIHNELFMTANRFSDKDFTRNRKLPFSSLILFMVNLVKQSLQKELTNFLSLFSSVKSKDISKSAFSQSRLKLKPEAFVELNADLINEFYKDNDINKWSGFRLLGIDGCVLQLPQSPEILNIFGGVESQSENILAAAQSSSCYDLLNEIIIDAQIDSYKTSEHMLALKHMEKMKKGDLAIYDRGYNARWLFFLHIFKGVDFLMRLRKEFADELNSFWDSEEKSRIINVKVCPDKSLRKLKKLDIKFHPFKYRVVKVQLNNGEIEVLATSLIDEKKYPAHIFKELYALRWGIETNYDHLKNNLEIEDFTGKSSISVQQDFFAKIFITNLQTVIARDAQAEIDEEKKDTEHRYKINRNLSLGFMKDRVIRILMNNKSDDYEELKNLFKLEPVPIRGGRNFPRDHRYSTRKYHMNKKKAF